MFKKKSQIPALKTITIIILVGITIISYFIILSQTSDIPMNNQKIETQLIESKILNSKCFGDEFGTIEESKFTQNNIESCFINTPINIAFLTNINSKTLYINENTYQEKLKFCSIASSNILCTNFKYPVIYINSKGIRSIEELRVQTIVN